MSDEVKKFQLSYSKFEKENISSLMTELLEEEVADLPPVKGGDINLSTLYLSDLGDTFEAKVIVRNASGTSVNFDDTRLRLVDENNNLVMDFMVNLRAMDIIPPYNARPYTLVINKPEDLKVPENGKILFANNVKLEASTKLELKHIDANIDPFQLSLIKQKAEEMLPIKQGEVSLVAVRAFTDENKLHHVYLLGANGVDREVEVPPLKIAVKDSMGLIVAYKEIENLLKLEALAISAIDIVIDSQYVSVDSLNSSDLTLIIKS